MPKTVLIVEDNELNLRLFSEILSLNGYATIEAREGAGVVDTVRARRPDLVLMDMQLPDASGLEITRLLKADPEVAAIPVVAITALAMKGDEERIRAGGCEGYISKPIGVQRLLDVVKQFVGEGDAPPAGAT